MSGRRVAGSAGSIGSAGSADFPSGAVPHRGVDADGAGRRIASSAHRDAQTNRDARTTRGARSSSFSSSSSKTSTAQSASQTTQASSASRAVSRLKRFVPSRSRRGRSTDAVSARQARSAAGSNTRANARQDISAGGTGRADIESGARSVGSGFVDARRLRSEDYVANTLRQTAGSLGVSTRPKVVDFTARRRERRMVNVKAMAGRIAIAVLALALVCTLIWALFFSSALRLEQSDIQVTGDNEWVKRSDVLDIADRQAGKSLLLVSTEDVAEQLGGIPGVTKADVVKRYPHGLTVTVESQEPAAIVKGSGGALVAVDSKSRVLNTVATASKIKGIPVIEVSDIDKSLQSRAVKEAVTILAGLPASMRGAISKVSAATQDSITTQLNGYTVVWGDSSQLKLKTAVVDELINRNASKLNGKKRIDVSAPTRPIVK